MYPVTVKASIVSLQQVTRRCRWQLWFRVSLRFLSTQASKAAFPSLGNEAEAFIKSPCLRNTHGGKNVFLEMMYTILPSQEALAAHLGFPGEKAILSLPVTCSCNRAEELCSGCTLLMSLPREHMGHIFLSFWVRFSCCNVLRKNTGIYT